MGEELGGFGELVPSIFSQRWPRPSGIHHPTPSVSLTPLSSAVSHQPPLPSQQSPSVTVCHLPALLFPRVPLRTPHPFIPARKGVFRSLWPPARGEGRGSGSVMARPGPWRPSSAQRGASGSVPRAASHPASGPGKGRRRMSGSRGCAKEGEGRGEAHENHRKK